MDEENKSTNNAPANEQESKSSKPDENAVKNVEINASTFNDHDNTGNSKSEPELDKISDDLKSVHIADHGQSEL